MAAIDDLTELVERAAAVEKVALSSKWRERPDVTKLIARVRENAAEQRDELARDVDPELLSSRWVSLRKDYLDLGAQEALPGQSIDPETPGDDLIGQTTMVHRLSHAAAAQAERDATASVDLARMALTDAALAVLQARLARIDAGEDEADAATVDGHVPLHGKNPVSRHGPALAHGVTGEINYILTRKPRGTVKSLAIALALGLLYLGWIRLAQWDEKSTFLPYLGLWVIGVVMGGGVCINAMSFDAMRVRAALDNGERLWHLLVIKNLALLCIVAPIVGLEVTRRCPGQRPTHAPPPGWAPSVGPDVSGSRTDAERSAWPVGHVRRTRSTPSAKSRRSSCSGRFRNSPIQPENDGVGGLPAVKVVDQCHGCLMRHSVPPNITRRHDQPYGQRSAHPARHAS